LKHRTVILTLDQAKHFDEMEGHTADKLLATGTKFRPGQHSTSRLIMIVVVTGFVVVVVVVSFSSGKMQPARPRKERHCS
jgi:hypothetical protein